MNPAFPAWNISAYIPGEKHGTREVFEEKVLEAGCEALAISKPHQGRHGQEGRGKDCMAVRKDGAAVDIDGDYTETLARIDATQAGHRRVRPVLLREQRRQAEVATMSGITRPSRRSPPASTRFSRPLQFYVKKAHLGVIPGLKEYVEFFVSDQMIGPDSPLANYGLVPAPDAERDAVREAFESGKTSKSRLKERGAPAALLFLHFARRLRRHAFPPRFTWDRDEYHDHPVDRSGPGRGGLCPGPATATRRAAASGVKLHSREGYYGSSRCCGP